MGKGQELYEEAKKYIPGGTQLLSKRPEMFLPEQWPAYYDSVKDCYITDLDGNEYIDVSLMGIGACILGYGDKDVDAAVLNAVKKGNMSTLNAPEEVELAKLLVEMHPWADMVRYARTGGESMVQAVRIARAYSKKDVVLFCGYHGWHDWYLSANLSDDAALDGHLLEGLSPNGVPRGLTGLSQPFRFNDSKGFSDLIAKFKGNIGCVVLEPIRNEEPDEDFLNLIQNTCNDSDIPLIVDEITSGFRLNYGGAHLLFGLEPDIAVFAKSISNGYPMAAILGKRYIMQAAQDSFISSTYWTYRIGPTAAIATLKKMKKTHVQSFIIRQGKRVQEIWQNTAEKYNLNIHVGSIYPLSHFDLSDDPLVLKTLFTQLMLEKGFIASTSFYVCLSHTDEILERYFAAIEDVFAIISRAVQEGNAKELLHGPVCHAGFKRLN